jgi:protein arginine kinase activator
VLCDNCGKEPAKIHYKEIKDNQVTEYHLCERCASEKGIPDVDAKQPFSIPNIMAEMADGIGAEMARCDRCGLTYKGFRDSGRLGCSACYEAFREQLKPLLRRIHGSNVHVGKSPKMSRGALEKRREVETLKSELGRAITCEDFEKAAEIRDRIRELEDQ